jgi:zinc protease
MFQPIHRLRTGAAATLLLALAGGIAPAAAQQPAPAGPKATQGATVEGITEYTLPNGLRVLLFPDPSKPTATVNMTYLVGSRHEGYGETGMAHLFEHMLFKGSKNHPDIPAELTAHGARPNGSTWYDRTNYFETFAATAENLEWALDLEADRMVNSFLRKEDLETEFTVVRNEFEAGENSPFSVLMERVLSTAFLWHGYGRSTIGARSDIDNVPIERLHAWYRRYNQPDNAILIVSGKFDPATTLAVIEEKFGAIPRPDRSGDNALYPTYTREPVQDGERTVTLRRVGDVQLVMAAYHVPAGSHGDFASIDLLAEVLGDAPSGRLYKALVDTKKAASVGAFSFQLAEPGVLLALAEVRKEDDVEAARAALVETLEGLASAPPTDEEVERARASLLKQFELNLNDPERVALEMSEWAAMGDWRLMFIHRDRLRAAKTADVVRVAGAYLKPANRTLGLFVPTAEPDRAEITEAPPIAALVAGYRGDTTRVAGEEFDPAPANIDARTQTVTLPNGMKLVMLPKRTRGGAVALSYRMRFGTEATLSGRARAGDFAGDMLMRGTAKRSRQEIQDALDRLQARGSIAGAPTSAYASLQTVRPHLAELVGLVAEVLREPAFDAAEFEKLREERLAEVETQKTEPMMVANVALARALNPLAPDHPQYTPTIDESIAQMQAVTLAEAKRFHAELYGPASSELVLVGDFDPAEMERVVREAFGDWQNRQPFERVVVAFQAAEPRNEKFETPDKANAVFLAGMNLPIGDRNPDYPALVMANYMLGGGFLNSRLATRIRQNEGLSYGVGSGFGASPLDEKGSFTGYAIFGPENVARLEAAFLEEIEKVRSEGFTQAELDAARAGWLQSRQVGRAQDMSLAAVLANNTYLGRTMAVDAELEAAVTALTLEQVNGAFRKHIDPARLVIVKAGDFANKAPKL